MNSVKDIQDLRIFWSVSIIIIVSYFLDFFKITDYKEANIAEMKRLLTFTATSDSKIEVRHYEINPGSKINETEVKQKVLKFNEIGPHFDLTLRREKLASSDLFKTACKQPKLEKPETKRNKKNLYTDELGQKMGKVFFQR